LVQRVRLEGLPGSAGQNTGLALSVGRLRMLIDASTIGASVPIHFGLGTVDVLSMERFETDGTVHATIAVEAGSPGAVFAAAAPPSTDRVRGTNAMRTHVERVNRNNDQIRASVQPQTTESGSFTRPMASLRAVRRPVDNRAVDRLLAL